MYIGKNLDPITQRRCSQAELCKEGQEMAYSIVGAARDGKKSMCHGLHPTCLPRFDPRHSSSPCWARSPGGQKLLRQKWGIDSANQLGRAPERFGTSSETVLHTEVGLDSFRLQDNIKTFLAVGQFLEIPQPIEVGDLSCQPSNF